MRPYPFVYHRPRTLEQAFELLDRYAADAALFAGGTELLLAMKARVLRYDHLIDLKCIPGMTGVRQDGGEIVIGALTSHHLLSVDSTLRKLAPAYAKLSDGIANIRVRVAGTIGGNLCFAEPHADPPALLAALDASVVLRKAAGNRRVPIADFIQSEFTTVREDDEVLTEVRFPIPSDRTRYVYSKFGHLERPAVTMAAGLVPTEHGPRYRIWAGAIGSRPVRVQAVERALLKINPAALPHILPDLVRTAAEGLPAGDDLHGSAEYKRHLAATLIRRSIDWLVADRGERTLG